MKSHILLTNGEVTHSDKWDFNRDFKSFQQVVNGHIEIVAVLYDGKPATMLVNEEGAIRRLKPNARATAIYWHATITGVTGVPYDPLSDPLIYGDVVLMEIDKRELR